MDQVQESPISHSIRSFISAGVGRSQDSAWQFFSNPSAGESLKRLASKPTSVEANTGCLLNYAELSEVLYFVLISVRSLIGRLNLGTHSAWLMGF
jgi:hypothetical protein